ncbi:MAG: hypothetical protein LJE59_13705 [Chromatiaceae bacterium]|nr:hypothetical protein [Chromatiaceae bacterium]
MLGGFVAAFFMWVAWGIITAKKAPGLLLAVLSFVGSWVVADLVGAKSPVRVLLLEVIVALLLFRIANDREKKNTRWGAVPTSYPALARARIFSSAACARHPRRNWPDRVRGRSALGLSQCPRAIAS